MRTAFSPVHYPDQSASVAVADRRYATPAYRFVLSRCLGSSSYYSLWLLEGTSVLEHWVMLADGKQGLRDSNIFLLQSAERLLPAAHYDEGPCEILPLPLNHSRGAEDLTMRQALTEGSLPLQLEGQRLCGRYLLQRVGAGRGHTWQLTQVGEVALQQLAVSHC